MPRSARRLASVRCVESEGHAEGHVVYTQDGVHTREIQLWYYRVDETQRSLRAAMHMDMRGPAAFTDEEVWALWQFMSMRTQ